MDEGEDEVEVVGAIGEGMSRIRSMAATRVLCCLSSSCWEAKAASQLLIL